MSDDKMTAFVQFVDPVPLPVTELLRAKPPKKKKTTKVEQKQTLQKPADGLLHCSFCGLSQGQVAKLIAGPNVYICSDCLKICIQILVEDGLLKDHSLQLCQQVALAFLTGWLSARKYRIGPLLHLRYFLAMMDE